MRELTVTGGQRRAQVASSGGGAVSDMEIAGSGIGDALIAFRSGSSTRGEISASLVDAPPITFAVTTPTDWVRPPRAVVRWDAARNALGPLKYEVFFDGVPLEAPIRGRALRVPRAALDDGRHRVQLRATDREGQRVLSNVSTLRIDGTAPTVRVTRRARRRVAVRISDAGRSGLDTERSTVAWGDGSDGAAANNQSHTYRRPGTYRVTVVARDRAGNTRRVTERVVVR
ncbi:PKD domain-containing protein [Svornostia abyssi]|uniref:PKD domain-containing protein n=1 Tax=Svornostia abyssi TaxID=2898438 RepID=A0ABY5PG87_9ACTN|nr:PKD domain-containing protein [Parviterribacteraceae bacterium J379]